MKTNISSAHAIHSPAHVHGWRGCQTVMSCDSRISHELETCSTVLVKCECVIESDMKCSTKERNDNVSSLSTKEQNVR